MSCPRACRSVAVMFYVSVASFCSRLRSVAPPRFPHPSAILMGDYISPLMMVRNAGIPAARSDEPWSRYAIYIEIARSDEPFSYTCVHVITLPVPNYFGHELSIADALHEVYPDIKWAVGHVSLHRERGCGVVTPVDVLERGPR